MSHISVSFLTERMESLGLTSMAASFEGYTAYYITAMDLFERLARAREQGKLKSRLKWFCKPHLLLMDDAVATATLDRLLHHVHIVSLQGDSYRMKDRMEMGVVDFL